MLFASLVDDPGSRPDLYPTTEAQEAKRQELFRLIEELVKWENSNKPSVLAAARAEILLSTDGNPPPVYDPFCGGGPSRSKPRTRSGSARQRPEPRAGANHQGAYRDPPKFAGSPGQPESRAKMGGHPVRGRVPPGWRRTCVTTGRGCVEQARARIGKLYPPVHAVQEADGSWRHATELEWIEWDGERLMGSVDPTFRGKSKVRPLTVIAWLWARTVASPNPAARGAHVPLVRSSGFRPSRGKRRGWSQSWTRRRGHTVSRCGRVNRTMKQQPKQEPKRPAAQISDASSPIQQ